MPSENREALMILLKFLNKVSKHFQQNQMNAYNLATCLMPTLFKFSDSFSKIPNINAHKNGSVKHKILRLEIAASQSSHYLRSKFLEEGIPSVRQANPKCIMFLIQSE